MANVVNSVLQFTTISEKGREVVNEIVEAIRSGETNDLGFAFSIDMNEINSNFMCEKVGAKWAFLTDCGDDMLCFESAWSPVEPFVDYVMQQVAEVDESVIAKYTYEDEMPNFVGVQIWNHLGICDEEELDHDDIMEAIFQSNPELTEEFDEEEGFTDKGYEILDESVWTFIHEWQEKLSQEMMNFDD